MFAALWFIVYSLALEQLKLHNLHARSHRKNAFLIVHGYIGPNCTLLFWKLVFWKEEWCLLGFYTVWLL
jgi:hypothetical protein